MAGLTPLDIASRQIPLTRGFVATVDLADYDRINAFTWHANVKTMADGTLYARAARMKNRVMIYMHYQVLDLTPADLAGKEIDHNDRDALNNRRANLRICTHAENMANSKFAGQGLGVTYNTRASLWMCYLDKPGQKRLYLGYTRSKAEGITRVEIARCS